MEVLLYESVTRALDRIGNLLTGFVFCFCEKDDLLSQWRGYGDLSSAFSIGIDLNELGTLTLARGDIRKVVYELEQQREMILRYMTDWLLVLQNLLDQDALDFAQLQLLRVGFIMGFTIALSIKAPAFHKRNANGDLSLFGCTRLKGTHERTIPLVYEMDLSFLIW